eukprot:71417-Prymnesium_polylepis.1
MREGTMSSGDVLQMLAEVLQADSVLPKAVLVAPKNSKISVYTRTSEFLDCLKDYRTSMTMFLGQSLAFVEEDGEVPDHMEHFVYSESEFELLCAGEWQKMDPLHHVLLALLGTEGGVEFATHDVKKLYHHGGMIDLLIKHASKLWWAIGYARQVDAAKGLTYSGFMRKLQQLHERSLAMEPESGARMHALIDELAARGHCRAAVNWNLIVHGSSPADRKLGPWLPASEPLLKEIDDLLKELKESAKFHQRTQGVFRPKPQAPMMPGFEKQGKGASSATAVALTAG